MFSFQFLKHNHFDTLKKSKKKDFSNPIMKRKAEELELSEEESKLSGSNSSGSDSRLNINPKKRSYQKEISIAIPTPTNQKLLESKMR